MTTSYVVISNTGNISGGLKLEHAAHSYSFQMPGADTFRGLNGDASQCIGAGADKVTLVFVGQARRRTAPDGYAAVEGTGQCVREWATSATPSKRLLKVTDAEGTTRDMLWDSPWVEGAMSNSIYGDTELLRFQVRLVEQ